MDIDANGKIINHKICESVINVDRRMSYTSVSAIVEDHDPTETEKYKEQVLGDNIWIENLKKKKNITKLTREIVIELIDCIYVHEGGDITIKFKFTDEYERMLEYIQMNEELTLISKAI